MTRKTHSLSLITLLTATALLAGCGGSSSSQGVDLNRVLDITVDTIYAFEEKSKSSVDAKTQAYADQAFVDFSAQLADNFNFASPVLHSTPLGVLPQGDASLIGFEDKNGNKELDQDENGLFKIEIDGQNSRVIATSGTGEVSDHRFSGTGILTGFLLGSLLSRQRGAGVSQSALANKKTVSASQAARSRAGSGSHSRGK